MLTRSDAPVAPSPPLAHRSPLSTTVVSDFVTVEGLRSEWLELLARSASNGAMLTPFWLLTWWEVFGGQDGRRLRVTLFREGQRLVGLAPLLARRHWYPPGIPFRRLEPLGTGERERDAICTDYLNVIAEYGYEQQVAEALAAAVTGGTLGPWDEFVVPMMDGEGPMPSLLVAAFRAAGAVAEVVQTGGSPFIPLPATWDHYLMALGKKHRYRIHRVQRDFEEWAGGQWRVDRVTSPEYLAKGKQVLVGLHHDRWDGVPDAGVFHSPHFLHFHDRVMPRLLRQGAMELLWLSVRGEPVAAMYNIVWGGKVYFYQCGRRTGLPRAVRPGSVLLHYAIRAAIEGEQREFDFLNGLNPYKLFLALAVRPLVQVRAARPSFVERLRRLAKFGRDQAKRVRAALQGKAPASAPVSVTDHAH
jgi:CelD/BcsL family acetyltransferase involved in cellulose biosynthesis